MTAIEQPRKHALISVHDKLLVPQLGHGLVMRGWQIHSFGGTREHLTERGVASEGVELFTGEPDLDRGEQTKRLIEHITRPRAEGAPAIDLLYMNPKPAKGEWRDQGYVDLIRAATNTGTIVMTSVAQVFPVLEWIELGQPDDQAISVFNLAVAAVKNVATYLKP